MRRLNPTVIALLGLIALIVGIWVFAGTRNADQDKLTGNVVTAQADGDPEKACSSDATYELLKRALFQHAAQQRGGDQATYDQLSQAASLRVEDPAMESQDKQTGAINCSGSVSIDLPPGVAAGGGRTNLMSDVDYTVQPAADGGSDTIVLKNADALVAPLATLSRTDQNAQQPAAQQPDDTNSTDEAAADQSPASAPPAVTAAPAQAPTPRPAMARPSFDCSDAHTAGEAAVCSDAGLAALDRSMAAQYGRAMAQADPDQRDLLQGTGERFLHYRDHCPTRACIGDAYTGRMREIRDIMAGTWRQP
ncbi:hypothetical protein [Sphingomonas sp.]|uniref:lysozyme inhibitor LprI family protein n=1 Tax=Sphingomonas sp. TaxID=28214 RepID=UPI0025FA1159|nr:hypothetical protein [Sphingomonas sp.]MBV9528884.1 hypothetical protein [Sphingomonas sp.]